MHQADQPCSELQGLPLQELLLALGGEPIHWHAHWEPSWAWAGQTRQPQDLDRASR